MKKLLSLVISICLLVAIMAVPVVVSAEDVNIALASAGATAIGGTGSNADPGRAIDGDSVTQWTAWTSDAATVKSLTVVLAKKAVLSKISFASTISTNQYNYSVFYKLNEDDDWTRVTLSKSGNNIQATLDGVTAQYIKVEYAAGKTMGISEFEVYGAFASSAYLNSLSVTEGTFTTAFNKDTTDYKVQVESLNDLPELTYEVAEGATAEITQVASEENGYVTKIAVTDGDNSKEYTVQFIAYNWALPANGTTISAGMGVLVDGNATTSSQHYLANSTPAILTFSDYVNIDSIKFYSIGGSTNTSYYKLSYSLDGNTWTELRPHTDCQMAVTNGSNAKYTPYIPVVAKYVKLEKTYTGNGGFFVQEIEVSGKKVTEEYTTNCTVYSNKVIANVTLTAQEAKNDNLYFMVVYVGGEIYDIVYADKSATTIAANGAATTTLTMSKTLTTLNNVTAKLFVWKDYATIVPVRTPITLK